MKNTNHQNTNYQNSQQTPMRKKINKIEEFIHMYPDEIGSVPWSVKLSAHEYVQQHIDPQKKMKSDWQTTWKKSLILWKKATSSERLLNRLGFKPSSRTENDRMPRPKTSKHGTQKKKNTSQNSHNKRPIASLCRWDLINWMPYISIEPALLTTFQSP